MKWTHYLRCDECGVDPGKACRDDNDREALEVCDGRRLSVGDSADRLQEDRRREREARPVRRAKPPPPPTHRAHAPAPTGPCRYCGTPTRLRGAAVRAGRSWCQADACQTDRRRQRTVESNTDRAPRKPSSRPHKVRPCVICGADVSAHGVAVQQTAACPGACRAERWRRQLDAKNERRRERREASPARVPCAWCGTSLPGGGRRPGQRACCGSVVCARARATETRRARGVRPRRRREAPPMEVIPPVVEGVPCDWCGVICQRPRHPNAERVACGPICDREINRSRQSDSYAASQSQISRQQPGA